MAKRRSQPSADKQSALFANSDSGATGGPATAHGVWYQLDIAIYEACQFIAENLAAPYKNTAITMESRETSEHGITRWDLSMGTPVRNAEVKTKAARKDILEWLARAGRADSTSRFTLIYAETSGRLIQSLEALIRVAKEAGTDAGRFESLCRHERIDDAETMLAQIGSTGLTTLQHMNVSHLPEAIVADQVQFMARYLAPSAPERFVQTLRDKFFQGLQTRVTYSIRDMINELQAKGIVLEAPRSVILDELPAAARSAIAVLRHCSGAGLPAEVLASAINCDARELSATLVSLLQCGCVIADENRWRLLIRSVSVPPSEEKIAVESGLAALLRYIDARSATVEGRSLVAEAINLTKACYDLNPKAVIRVFRLIEKLLKRVGNKHLVLELADLTIAASRVPPCDDADVRARAQALICGRSWALQRLGDLPRARIEAAASLQLGQDIGWDRNTAFCLKCTGRLARMQAEQLERVNPDRNNFLEESLNLLNAAIEAFTNMNEIGPTHAEVGDCYSLIARTYLVFGKLDRASEALRRAYELIPPEGSKDHLDLLILTGDLSAAQTNREDADYHYSKAIDLPQAADVQISEMFARAYFQRAKNRAVLRRRDAAARDYRAASDIWRHNDEHELAAKAEWEALLLEGQIHQGVRAVLEQDRSFLVRITAHQQLTAQHADSSPVVAQRQQPPRKQIEQSLKDARRTVAIQFPRA